MIDVMQSVKLIVFTLSLAITHSVSATVINFDSLSPDDAVTTLSGVSFSSNIPGLDLIASNIFDATSGENSLGVRDGGFGGFLPGDEITLNFAEAITELSLSFISSPGTPSGAFRIDTLMGSSISQALPSAVLGDGGEVFEVMFSSAMPFSTATFGTVVSGLYSFNIDDIIFDGPSQIPVPGSTALLALGLAVLAGLRKTVLIRPMRDLK